MAMKKLLLLLTFIGGAAYADTTTVLRFVAPTKYEDGRTLTPSRDIVKYTLYRGTTSGQYTRKTTISPTTRSIALNNLAPGTHYFTLTATSAELKESRRSNEVSLTINDNRPSRVIIKMRVL
jgi:hypothetical protein